MQHKYLIEFEENDNACTLLLNNIIYLLMEEINYY